MKKLLGLLGLIAVANLLPVITAASINNTKDYAIRYEEPIVHEIGYSKYFHMSVGWSYSYEDKDTHEYILIDYDRYAKTWREFYQRYPTITIDTSGEAICDSIFGDAGKYNFGPLTYDTNNFIANDDVYYIDILNVAHNKWATYNVRVNIKLGFKHKNNNLYLVPSIYGYFKSHGMFERQLDFGLTVSKITFNTKSQFELLNSLE